MLAATRALFLYCKHVDHYDFCEAQDGKGNCDQTAATIKSGIQIISARHKMGRGIMIKQQQQSNQENI